MDSPDDLSEIIAKREQKNISVFGKIIMIIGIALCCQFLVCGIVGVTRGYSIQSSIPTYINFAGLLILLFYVKRNSYLSYFVSFMLIYYSIVGIYQGDHEYEGNEFYGQENYQAAIFKYKKEIDTWYLRLHYNYHEASSMYRIAKCYAQLEEFGQAREAYKKVSEIFDGHYKKRAKLELLKLDETLQDISCSMKKLESETDDNQKADLLFDLAWLYRGIGCDKEACEQYSLIQNLNIRESRKEQARKFARKKWWID